MPTSDNGTVTAGISVARTFRRNRKITITTRPTLSSKRELHVGDRSANGLGAVGQDRDLDRRRDRGFELRQRRLDPVDGLDHVGAGLPLDGEDDRALLVVPTGEQVVLRAGDRLADVADPHRRPVLIGDDQVVVLLRL